MTQNVLQAAAESPLLPTAPALAGHPLRPGVLGLPDALAQSVTVMAPTLAGGFITYLVAIKAGGATPLAFVLATLACLLIGAVVSEFARTLRSAGSLYTYAVHGLGPFWGFVTGWAYLAAIFLAGPAVLAGSGVFLGMAMEGLGAPSLAHSVVVVVRRGALGLVRLGIPGCRAHHPLVADLHRRRHGRAARARPRGDLRRGRQR
jgi:amino acid transporter